MTVPDVSPADRPSADPYATLDHILMLARRQSSDGKGAERHTDGDSIAWENQPIIALAKSSGFGGPMFQAMKKLEEAARFARNGKTEQACAEILGAIVYSAAMFYCVNTEKTGD